MVEDQLLARVQLQMPELMGDRESLADHRVRRRSLRSLVVALAEQQPGDVAIERLDHDGDAQLFGDPLRPALAARRPCAPPEASRLRS